MLHAVSFTFVLFIVMCEKEVMHMLNIYTSRQKLIGRNVVYNLHDFFDNTVVNAIRQKRYELTEEDR